MDYKNNRRLLSLLATITFTVTAWAQHLTGKVCDTKGEPIEGATIVVQNLDSVVVGACITDSCGQFRLDDTVTPYILIVRHLAYSPFVSKDSVGYKEVTLDSPAYELHGITVRGRLPMRVNDNGALQYSGRLLIENRPVRNVLDMLNEIPTLQKQGTQYSIVGATSFCILINGNKSGMSGEQLQAYLSSLSPERVASIDVYYNTPRRFGVRGASVNIVLTKNRSKQIETKGDIWAGLSQATYTGANGGVNLGFSSAKWSANIGYSGVYDHLSKELELDAQHQLQGQTYQVAQDSKSVIKSFDNSLLADADITLNDKSSISLSYVLQEEKPKVTSSAMTVFSGVPNPSDTHTKNHTWLHNIEAAYYYNDLEIGVNATLYKEKENQDLTDAQQSSLDGRYKQSSAKYGIYLDDCVDFLGGSVNFGFRGDLSKTTNNKDYHAISGFTGESFRFEQKEQSGAAYIGYKHPLGQKGFVNVSLEGEYFHSSYNKNADKATTLWEQWQLYPSLTLVYRPTKRNIIQLTLNSEKFYPSYWTTAANRTYINAYCVIDGNIELKPYVKYSCNLNYIIKSKYIFGAFAETSPDHFIQSMLLSDSELHAIYKYFNLKRDYRYGLMAIAPVEWTSDFQSRLTAMVFDMHQSGCLDNKLNFSKSKITSMLRLNNSLSLCDKKLNLELSGWYQFAAIQGYYDVRDMYSVSAAISWITPVKGLTLTLKGEDIFDTYRMKTKCHLDKMRYTFCNNVDMQSFSITARYTFNGYKDHKKKSVDTSRYGL